MRSAFSIISQAYCTVTVYEMMMMHAAHHGPIEHRTSNIEAIRTEQGLYYISITVLALNTM